MRPQFKIHIDLKYAKILCSRYNQYKQLDDYTFQFRCPICGDSQKSKTKARGYIFRKENILRFMCHNCGASKTFYSFLKEEDGQLFSEYSLEMYKDGSKIDQNAKSATIPSQFKQYKPNIEVNRPKIDQKIVLPSIADLDTDHAARVYVDNRKLPQSQYENLYYTEDFGQFAVDYFGDRYKYGEEKLPSDARIVIPFYNHHGKLIGAQGRATGSTSMRYITLRASSDIPLIYGLNALNLARPIFVVEGPFDSMFMENCIAITNSQLLQGVSRIEQYYKIRFRDAIYIFDNEPRNKDIHKQMRKVISAKKKILIWPKRLTEKDINDMIKAEVDVKKILRENVYQGLLADVKMKDWIKC